jgi:cyclopropane fatty-acyl-phospholipid synthase-like methyltransferase
MMAERKRGGIPMAPDDTGPEGWVTFFDRLGTSDMHQAQAVHFVRSLRGAVGFGTDQRLLDLGCGPGLVAGLVAPLVDELWWWDPSPNMRELAARATNDRPNAHLCDLGGAGAGSMDARIPGAPFDMIIVNSVVQYMTPSELDGWLHRWPDILTEGGRIVLSDLIDPDQRPTADISDLIRFAVRQRSPIRAFRESLGDVRAYRSTSRKVPLTRVGPDELARRASEGGLEMDVLPRNLTHLGHRWTAILRPRA